MSHLLHHRTAATLALVSCLTIASAAHAQSQSVEPLPSGPGSIVGRIIDKSGAPVDSAEVRVTDPARSAFSDGRGLYRLIGLKGGKYEITVRKFGYLPQRLNIALDDKGGTLNFTVERSTHALPTVVTTATRHGLSGTIADSSRRAISNALVTVVAENRDTRSDSTGAFYVDLKPGRYLVRITHSVFSSQLVSVTIPPDHGRHVELFMSPAVDAGAAKAEVFRDMALKERLIMRYPMWSRVLTREDIELMGSKQTVQLAIAGAQKFIKDVCPAVIDGGRDTLPLWAIDPRDIEVMEVYTERPLPGTSKNLRSIEASRSIKRDNGTPKCPATMYVWFRK